MAMRFYEKGSNFGVTVGRDEVYAFKRVWPASGLGRGPYFFEFDKRSGDLVDVAGPGAGSGGYADTEALVALSQDAQKWGKCRMEEKTARRRGRTRCVLGAGSWPGR